MTEEQYNVFISDLEQRVTAGTLDPELFGNRTGSEIIASVEAQAVLRYFYVKLVKDPGAPPLLNGPVPSLRLLKVLRMLGAGLGNKAIAWELGWSHEGVKSAVTRLFRRCGCRNRWALGLWVNRHSAWLEREIHQLEVLETSNVNGVVFYDQLPSSNNMSTF